MTARLTEPSLNLTEDSHRRLNPLTNEWVLVSPHRATRPWQGAVDNLPQEKEPHYSPDCYLCPGNPRAGGAQNPPYTSTFVFDNDFASLKRDTPHETIDVGGKGLMIAEGESGICRVMCFSPRHDLTLSTMPLDDVGTVIRTWIDQFQQLGSMPHTKYVQIFENRGAMMGASNPHPHCQIWATSSIPQMAARELLAQQAYSEVHGKCLLCEYTTLEAKSELRIIHENAAFVALVPFWAIWPFEILLCSRRHFGTMQAFTTEEASLLGHTIKHVTSSYDALFNVPFPYSMGFHQSPLDGEDHPEWHFHAHFYPPLLRSATIRKYMVGFEMLGTPQRDITPESAAERLRASAPK
jgi:UDPglucose--hexose-1-phosphate uridylyltransferase